LEGERVFLRGKEKHFKRENWGTKSRRGLRKGSRNLQLFKRNEPKRSKENREKKND